jgi:hypothetical protein
MPGRVAATLVLTIVHPDDTIHYINIYPLLHLLGVNEIRQDNHPFPIG